MIQEFNRLPYCIGIRKKGCDGCGSTARHQLYSHSHLSLTVDFYCTQRNCGKTWEGCERSIVRRHMARSITRANDVDVRTGFWVWAPVEQCTLGGEWVWADSRSSMHTPFHAAPHSAERFLSSFSGARSLCLSVYTCVHVLHLSVCLCLSVCMYIHTYIHTYMHMYVRTYIHT